MLINVTNIYLLLSILIPSCYFLFKGLQLDYRKIRAPKDKLCWFQRYILYNIHGTHDVTVLSHIICFVFHLLNWIYILIMAWMSSEKVLISLCKTSGTLAMGNLILTFILSIRMNPLVSYAGYNFQSMHTMHSSLGFLTLLEIVVHFTTFLLEKEESLQFLSKMSGVITVSSAISRFLEDRY